MANDKDFKVKNDLNIGGNITVSGTVDGRDIASDGTKLDTIETNAKDDQTITAGAGLTGGGTGDVTLNVGAGTGVTVNANDIAIGQAVGTSDNVTFHSVTTTGNVVVGGNLQVTGTTTTVDTQDLNVTDNMIYMAAGYADSAGAPIASVDIGFAAGVNDNGSYEHVGFFRDATDDRFKVFKGYTPEPDDAVEIDTGHVSFSLADLQAATFHGALSGNASTATQLQTTRTIALSGDVTGSTTFNGSGNATISTTIAANSVALGTDTTGNYVATITGTTNEIEVSGSGSETAAVTIGLPNDVTIGNDLSVTNNISMSGSNFYFDGTTSYLRSDNQFYFLTDGGSAQVGSFKGLQVSTSYSGTVPDNGILFGTDTTLYRYAANKLSTGTSDSFIVPSGYVGIGIATPQYPLHISGSSATRADMLFTYDGIGNGATDGMQVGIQASAGGYNWVFENMDWYVGTNNTRRMTVDSSGNVGIGTANPGSKLEVYDNNYYLELNRSGDSGYHGIQISSTGTTRGYVGLAGASGHFATGSVQYDLVLRSESNLILTAGGSTPRVNILSNGNVGIGNSTPWSKLWVEGDGINLDDFSFEDASSIAQFTVAGSNSHVRLHMGTMDVSPYGGYIQASYDNTPDNTGTGNSGAEPLLLNPLGGNVGIGTTSPDTLLHVNGQAKFENNIILNENTPALIVPNGDWRIFTGGAEKVRITSTGSVGIGTSSPIAKLQVGASGSNTRESIVIGTNYPADSTQTGKIKWHDGSNVTGQIHTQYNGSTVDMHFGHLYNTAYNTTSRLVIKGNGNVGIGTTSPSYNLHVSGTTYSTSDVRAPVFYDSNDTAYYVSPNTTSSVYGVAIRGDAGTTDSVNQIFFWGAGDTTTSAIGFKANGGEFANPTGNGDGYNTYFTMDTAGRGWVFRRGTGGSNFTSAYNAGWILNNGVWQANASMRAPVFYDSNDTARYIDPANGGFNVKSGSGNRVTITTNDSGVRVDNAEGNGLNDLRLGAAWGHVGIYAPGEIHVMSSASIGFIVNNSQIGTIDGSGNLTMSGNVTAYSDINLKENIEVIPHALEKVKAIRGVTYNRNDIEDKPRHAGVIAQEVEKVLPEVVSENDEGIKNVAYGNMVGLLIEAMKEQQEIIDRLQARVEALENN